MATKTVQPVPFASETTHEGDLSAEVASKVEREPGDHVRCRSIGGNRYRCNWWSPRHGGSSERGGTPGLESTELRVRKSCLLVVVRDGDRLVMSEAAR